MNARSRATRTFVSMLVLFFLRRPGIPSKPREGEDRELGLGRVLSMDMVSDEGKANAYKHKTVNVRLIITVILSYFKLMMV